jgi:hypothetical protein
MAMGPEQHGSSNILYYLLTGRVRVVTAMGPEQHGSSNILYFSQR